MPNKPLATPPAIRTALWHRAQSAEQHAAAVTAVQTLLLYIGEDITRPGLEETPERVLKAWRECWGRGYLEHKPELHIKCFPHMPDDQMVVVSGIAFYSMCEHHMAPFYGYASIAYIPDARGVTGLSKLARVVDGYSRRLQVQEGLTRDIADGLTRALSADVGVRLAATHTCMSTRGVMQPNALTTTTALRGEFYANAQTRAEFLRAVSPRSADVG